MGMKALWSQGLQADPAVLSLFSSQCGFVIPAGDCASVALFLWL